MKDYKELINLKDEFITNYNIVNNEIIIYYSNELVVKEPYTKELEKEILTKMENQAKKALSLKENIKNQVNSDMKISLIMFILTVIHIMIFIIGSATIITYISSPIILTLFLIGFKDTIKGNNKIQELKKIEYFFKNQLEINKSNNLKTLKLSKKAIKHIESKNIIFDINSIDYFSLNDLRKIKEFIDKEYKSNEEINQKVKFLK